MTIFLMLCVNTHPLTCYLSEDGEQVLDQYIISDACELNSLTLSTRIFGRGTDFQVNDDTVEEIGGPHVIQTFCLLKQSEEIQIKGQIARHGGKGSYGMVLKLDKLIENVLKYKLDSDEINGAVVKTTIYDSLGKQRNKYCQKYCSDECQAVLDNECQLSSG